MTDAAVDLFARGLDHDAREQLLGLLPSKTLRLWAAAVADYATQNMGRQKYRTRIRELCQPRLVLLRALTADAGLPWPRAIGGLAVGIGISRRGDRISENLAQLIASFAFVSSRESGDLVTFHAAELLDAAAELGTAYCRGKSVRHYASEAYRHALGEVTRPLDITDEHRTHEVLVLARGIYQQRAFDRMPILADALEETGYGDDDVLSHLRSPDDVFTRADWVLQALGADDEVAYPGRLWLRIGDDHWAIGRLESAAAFLVAAGVRSPLRPQASYSVAYARDDPPSVCVNDGSTDLCCSEHSDLSLYWDDALALSQDELDGVKDALWKLLHETHLLGN